MYFFNCLCCKEIAKVQRSPRRFDMDRSAGAHAAALTFAAFIAFGLPLPAMAQNAQGRFLDVIVRLDDSFSPGRGAAAQVAAASIARSLGVQPRHVYGSVTFGFAAQIPEGRLAALRNDPRVQNVRLTRMATTAERITAKPDCNVDPSHPSCGGEDSGGGQVTSWGYDRIGADVLATTGQGIHVFVFDTGIDSDHPDLQANLAGPHLAVETCKEVSFPFVSDCDASKEPWDDDHSHGTHVSGIIGALDNDSGIVGVAPNVTLHAVKVLDWSGMGPDSGIIQGMDWVVDLINDPSNGIDAPVVVNMSLGTPNVFKAGTCDSSGYTPDDPSNIDAYNEAFCNAANAGVVFVVAAGNDDADAASVAPAAYDDAVITVSATMINRVGRGKNKTEVDDWPSWSNWGDGEPRSALATGPVALAAPGDNILSLLNDGTTGTKSGTSMASPFVAGAAAAYLEGVAPTANSGYGWFLDVRDTFLNGAELTSSWNNSSGNPHDEGFLDATQSGGPAF
jgi:subtilisin